VPNKSRFTPFWLFLIASFLIAFDSVWPGVGVLVYQKRDTVASNSFGWAVAGVGDVNGDGIPDFIVGDPSNDIFGQNNAGSVYLYSGIAGILLYQKHGVDAGDIFGYAVSGTGDVNGDGRADFIVGAPFADPAGVGQGGIANVFSGATGDLLYSINGSGADDNLGTSIGGLKDVNGDGRSDFIVGNPGADPSGLNRAGSAYVYSGIDGSFLFQKDGVRESDNFGSTVTGVGDVNGDGKGDILIGNRHGYSNYEKGVYLYSGANGLLLHQKDFVSDGSEGFPVAGLGDIDGDGKDDFIVGDPRAFPNGLAYAGSAYVYSGATGTLLYEKTGSASSDYFGSSVTGAGDVDGDGTPDFIVGAALSDPEGLYNAGSVYVYSGATGTQLCQINGFQPEDYFGTSVAGLGDINGDGKSELVIGAHEAYSGGSAYVYSYCSAIKGDINNDTNLTPSDIVLELNCIFLGSGDCSLCFADVNCDGLLTPADVVVELNAVFLGAAFPC
jgi:hypothetical protein